MNILKVEFFFALWHQGGIECVLILIASTVESELGKMQKHQEVSSSTDSQELMLHTHP